MLRIKEHHHQGFDLWHILQGAALVLGWVGVVLLSDRIASLPALVLITALSLLAAVLLRDVLARPHAGSWLTLTHLHLYDGEVHQALPLDQIRAIHGLGLYLLPGVPVAEFNDGRRLPLPRHALPAVWRAQRWMAPHQITVSARSLPQWTLPLQNLLRQIDPAA